jgi:aromatic-amino-acid transaminase
VTTGTLFSSVVPGARDRAGNDPIFALNAEAARRAAAGESIVNATLGALMTDDGRLAVMPTVLETMARALDATTAGYAPIAGAPAFLRASIADLFGERAVANQAVAAATPGGTGAIYQAVVNFLEPGQRLLTTSYFWGPYREIAGHAGRDVDTFEMFSPKGGFDIDGLATALDRHLSTQGRALVALNFPCHNPTGYSLTEAEWRAVADQVRRAGEVGPVTLLLDCAYLRFGGTAAEAWVHAVPKLLETITVAFAWTASKSFAQYGARVGALVALHRDEAERAQIANALGYTCRATWSNCNHLGQRAVTELLTDAALRRRTDRERQGLVALLGGRIAAFNEAAEAVGLSMPRYDSGFFVTVFSPNGAATAASMREAGVYVVPVSGGVRVALCSVAEADVPRLVDALGDGVRAARGYGGRT